MGGLYGTYLNKAVKAKKKKEKVPVSSILPLPSVYSPPL